MLFIHLLYTIFIAYEIGSIPSYSPLHYIPYRSLLCSLLCAGLFGCNLDRIIAVHSCLCCIPVFSLSVLHVGLLVNSNWKDNLCDFYLYVSSLLLVDPIVISVWLSVRLLLQSLYVLVLFCSLLESKKWAVSSWMEMRRTKVDQPLL